MKIHINITGTEPLKVSKYIKTRNRKQQDIRTDTVASKDDNQH